MCVSIVAATTGREGKRDLHSSASSSSSSFLQCCYIDAFCWLCGTVGRRRRIIAHRRKKCLMMSCSLVKKRKTKKSQAVCTRRATWTETRGDREIIRQSAAVTFQNKRIHHTGRHAVVANRCLIWSTADWLNDTSILSIWRAIVVSLFLYISDCESVGFAPVILGKRESLGQFSSLFFLSLSTFSQTQLFRYRVVFLQLFRL